MTFSTSAHAIAHYRSITAAQSERASRIGTASKMQYCTGPCKKRHSIGQFANGSSVCIRCARGAA